MKVVQLSPFKEETVSIENVQSDKLYLRLNKSTKAPDAILTISDGKYTFNTLDVSFTRGNYYTKKETLQEALLFNISNGFKVLQFDNMRELMQYCIDHNI